jgi:hypothetical protein
MTIRLMLFSVLIAFGLQSSTPATAAIVKVKTGVIRGHSTMLFIPLSDLHGGQKLSFDLDFGNAAFAAAQLEFRPTVISQFWALDASGNYYLDMGPDESIFSCFTLAGESCANDTLFGGGAGLQQSGDQVTGFFRARREFDRCFGNLYQVVGAICSEKLFTDGFVGVDFDETFPDAPYRLTTTLTGVPEPASWATMIFGFLATGVFVRRRKRKMVLQFLQL